MKSVAERLIEYRNSFEPKMTQTTMVQLLGGCSVESYRKWEWNITQPNDENMEKIEKILKTKNI